MDPGLETESHQICFCKSKETDGILAKRAQPHCDTLLDLDYDLQPMC